MAENLLDKDTIYLPNHYCKAFVADRKDHNLQADKDQEEKRYKDALSQITSSFSMTQTPAFNVKCSCDRYYPSFSAQMACQGKRCPAPEREASASLPTRKYEDLLVADWVAKEAKLSSSKSSWCGTDAESAQEEFVAKFVTDMAYNRSRKDESDALEAWNSFIYLKKGSTIALRSILVRGWDSTPSSSAWWPWDPQQLAFYTLPMRINNG